MAAMSTEHMSKFATIHQELSRLEISEKFSKGTKNSRQTNKHNFVKKLIINFPR